MARLKHVVTGVVVHVSDEKAASLSGGAYVPASEPQTDKKPQPARRAKTADDK